MANEINNDDHIGPLVKIEHMAKTAWGMLQDVENRLCDELASASDEDTAVFLTGMIETIAHAQDIIGRIYQTPENTGSMTVGEINGDDR